MSESVALREPAARRLRPTALARIGVLLMTMVLSGCSVASDVRVRDLDAVPAHWVARSDTFEPDWGDFTFDALSFATPAEGWIIGNRYFLHIAGDRLSVTFVRPTRAWMESVDITSPGEGWAGGFQLKKRAARGVIWHLRGGRWTSVDLDGLAWPDWFVRDVRASPRGEIWATAGIELRPDHELSPAPRRVRATLLRSDGLTWREDRTPRDGPRRWAFHDMCFQPSGEGWFVGVDLADLPQRQALAVRRRDRGWERVLLPALTGPGTTLSAVRCLGGDRVVALGWIRRAGEEAPSPIPLRYDGSWHRLELPEAFRHADVQAIAAASDADVWMAIATQDACMRYRPTFLHWVGGAWTEVRPPAPPGGQVGGYLFKDMQFVSPDEGWAIANADGFVHGLIFHYKGGVWRRRNWGWHFWDAPGFGLWDH